MWEFDKIDILHCTVICFASTLTSVKFGICIIMVSNVVQECAHFTLTSIPFRSAKILMPNLQRWLRKLFKVRKSQIRRFLCSFRYCKSTNFLDVPVWKFKKSSTKHLFWQVQPLFQLFHVKTTSNMAAGLLAKFVHKYKFQFELQTAWPRSASILNCEASSLITIFNNKKILSETFFW